MIDKVYANIYKDIKPTGHHQICPWCSEDLEKGKERICVIARCSSRGFPGRDYFHPECFIKLAYHLAEEHEMS